ncbi:MAG TPA: cell division protein FtsQ/DivIB [Bacteroidota bacterium]
MSGSRAKKYGLLGLLVAFAGLIVFANFWKSSLKVTRVTLQGNRIVEANELFQLAQVKRGVSIYDVDLKAIQKNLLTHCYVKEAIVGRNLPSTIELTVVERTPIALVNRSEIVYLDEDGVVLPRSISKALFDLPVLSGLNVGTSLSYGSVVRDSNAFAALRILRAAKLVNSELYHLISEVQVRADSDLVVYTAEGGVPVIVGEGNIADKLVRLNEFWNQVIRERGLQDLQYVDLRFDDQIVARWSTQAIRTRTM